MKPDLSEILASRTLILDGACGTMLLKQSAGYVIPDFFTISDPGSVRGLHRAYLEAGADIIRTNTFNSHLFSLPADCNAEVIRSLNIEGARLARREADRQTQITPARPRFVAGSIGPTPVAPSHFTADDDRLAAMADGWLNQALALVEGGVDMLLLETFYDAGGLLLAIDSVMKAVELSERDIPCIVSAASVDESVLAHCACQSGVAAVGLNCVLPDEASAGRLSKLAAVTSVPLIFAPNAGLPDRNGDYYVNDSKLVTFITRQLDELPRLCIAGGCCGTTPSFIKLLNETIGMQLVSPSGASSCQSGCSRSRGRT